jgi:hypothetical protein
MALDSPEDIVPKTRAGIEIAAGLIGAPAPSDNGFIAAASRRSRNCNSLIFSGAGSE